jgi:hypothetical protein
MNPLLLMITTSGLLIGKLTLHSSTRSPRRHTVRYTLR